METKSPKSVFSNFGGTLVSISFFSLYLEFEDINRARYGRHMGYEILDLTEYEEDQDLMDMDIEAVRETKTPAVICRYV